ncbi:Bts1 [Kluyveromyces lactis]|nr:Bts1 [Kluyveromyces lactis]
MPHTMDSLDQIIYNDALQTTKPVTEPFEYLLKQQGKRVRTLLIEEFGKLYEVPKPSIDAVSAFIDELHTASLLIDDIEDNAELRRGQVAAHKKYGIWTTLNSAQCAVYVSISKLLAKEHEPSLPSIINDELIRLHVGQGQDIYWRDDGIVPSVNEYYEMAKNKTGGLFRLMVRLLHALSKKELAQKYDLIPLANAAGILYQIRDDYLNLFSKTMFEQKGFADDLTEGKFSFPIIHAIASSRNKGDNDDYVLKTVLSRPSEVRTKEKLLSYLENQTKSGEYTRQVIQTLAQKVTTELVPKELSSVKDILSKLSHLD